MADIFTAKKRSQIMSCVKSKKNTSTELKLISLFDELAIHGWKRNYNVIGHPDFVFLEKHIAIFVDGCFWHGHDCRNTRPTTNQEYWEKKRSYNIEHDKQVTKRFTDRGWAVIRIWECELKKKNRDILYEKIQPILYQLQIPSEMEDGLLGETEIH
jgi:DNA mismatch endonuclease (patch repair protein)